MRYVIDSYAGSSISWEPMPGGKLGPLLRDEEKFALTICIAEIYAETLKVEGREMAEKQLGFIKEQSAIVPLDEGIVVKAAVINNFLKGVEAGSLPIR